MSWIGQTELLLSSLTELVTEKTKDLEEEYDYEDLEEERVEVLEEGLNTLDEIAEKIGEIAVLVGRIP